MSSAPTQPDPGAPPASTMLPPATSSGGNQQSGSATPPDSPALTQSDEKAVDEAVTDQRYRRWFRVAIVVATIAVITTFMANLSFVVCSVVETFSKSMDNQTLAEAIAGQVVAKSASDAASASSAPTVGTFAPSGKHVKVAAPAYEPKLKIEAKIFGEIRDSLIPVVALVSILTVAVVAILITLLRASFAQIGVARPSESEGGIVIPVAAIEAFKPVVEFFRSIFGK